jgi:tripartite-type tricarboxylate transporter receptor subunit TctC
MRRRSFVLAGLPAAFVPSRGYGLEAGDGIQPDGQVRLVVPFPPGGGSDSVARLVASAWTAAHRGVSVVVDNRPGAGGAIGAAAVAQTAEPNTTLLLADAPFAAYPMFSETRLFDPLRDFIPITQVAFAPIVLAVNPSAGFDRFSALVEACRTGSDSVMMASGGVGGIAHLMGLAFSTELGVAVTHVPYKGTAQAALDLMANRVSFLFAPAPVVMPHIQQGKLRALAITARRGLSGLPGVPSFAELGFDRLSINNWYGLFGAKSMAPRAAEQFHVAVALINSDKHARATADRLGLELQASASVVSFREFFASEVARWRASAR